MNERQRGMALVQALVIVAAVAAVATALMQQADRARQRLEARAGADQTALYLDAGVEQVRAILDVIPAGTPVHRRQDWAQPRDGLVIDRGRLAYRIEDLNARLNVNALSGDTPQTPIIRAAFVRLAQQQGMNRRSAERMADALGPDIEARVGAGGETPLLALPLVDPRQLWPLAGTATDEFADLLPFLAARPAESPMNINTLLPEVLQALLPDLSRTSRAAWIERIEEAPVASLEEMVLWAEGALPPGQSEVIAGLPLTAGSTRFLARIEARLDTVVLRRSVVLDRGGSDGRVTLVLSLPETPQ